jgi:hypothetical protein
MSKNVSLIREIIVATVNNPSFFIPLETSDNKIKQVTDLIAEVYKSVKED